MSDPGRRTIVVIDDDVEMLRVVEGLLRQAGHGVVTCDDPIDAAEVVARVQPDLILCDIVMPKCDGYEVLRALQSDPRTAALPVVFLTGRSEFTERVRAFRHGAVDYVAKPFTREVLVRRVEKLLEGLDKRAGATAAQGAEATTALIGDLRREARSGVLTVREKDGERRLVVRAGEFVEGAPSGGESSASGAEFRELDPTCEAIVSSEPAWLGGEAKDVPDFHSLPQALRSVLIVEDDAQLRDFLAKVLSQQGLEVLQAKDGEEALGLIFQERPWLIITDTVMPRLDGFELCRRVRAHSLVGRTPVVFLSGWDDYASRYRALELGADEYISKTSPLRELLMRLHLILARYAALGGQAQDGRMRGGLDTVGPVGLLQMCHLNRLTGVLSIRSGPRLVEIRWSAGEVVAAESDRAQGIEVVQEILGWTRGYFEFAPTTTQEGQPLDAFTHLLLEGCRLLDEKRAAQEESPKP